MARIPRVMVDADWLRQALAGAAPHAPPHANTPPFAPHQVHRLTNVLRLEPGALVDVFADGVGAFRGGLILDGAAWRLTALAPVDEGTVPAQASHGSLVTIACGWPRARRADFLIEKLVELNVACLQPVVYARSARGEIFGAAKLDRYRRLIAKACEQSRRNRLLELAAPLPLAELLASAAAMPDTQRFVATGAADTGAQPLAAVLHEQPGVAPDRAQAMLLVVGPEGGLTAEEIAAAVQAGFQPVTLGPLTLRVETAAVACAVLATQFVSP